MMKLSDLENWGVQFMANRVNFENLATTWDFAKSMRMGSLMKTCINLMQAQFMNFVSTDLFVRLPADTVLTLLRNDNLSVDSEEDVFEAISSWVAAGDKECDNERLSLHAPEMLKEVRWCQTTLQFRSRLVDTHPMFQESTSCARFMSQVEQWMSYADKDKPPCPFNRRRRPPQTIFFVFGKDEDQDRWSVLRFDPHLEKEERIADMEKREDATYSLVGESIFVVGGDTAQGRYSTSVEEFLVAERRWRKRASLAVGRYGHAAAVLTEAGGEALIGVFGGYNSNDKYLSSCEVYEVSRDRWSKLPDLREKRNVTAAACLPGDSRIFVFGGYNGSFSPLASVEFCQLRADWRERATSSDFWQPAAPMRTARSGLAATHFRGKIIVAGGSDGRSRLNMVEMFTPPDARCPRGQWTELAGMKAPREFFALLTSTDDAIFALGCWNGSGNTVETFTAPGGSADVSNDLTAWSWSSKKPLETLESIAGAASIRIPSPKLNVATGDPEAVLQRLESLVFQHHKPKFWARYVDDTFVVIDRDQLLTFKERLNAVFSDIQFTMEEEENNQLAFLDVLVCRKDCGGLKTKVFRKATNTMQVLNFNSNHPISHKRSCVRTLYRRVETHCSEPEDKIAELQYLRRVFKANGYPRNFVNRCIRKRDERPNRTDTKVWRALPYVKNVSEAVGRLLAPLGVGVAHRPEATIRRQLMKPKDPLPRQETSGVVYRIWCSCGQSNYVGETGRQLQTRMAEHAAAVRRNDANSQVAAHSTGSGHTFKFDEAEILARGDNRVSRELLESWFTGPQSINKCNYLPIQYSVLRLRLGGVIGHAGSAQVNTHPNTQVSASDGRAIITPASNARDEIAAINDANVGHHARATIPDEGGEP
ncbi:hypothetical protein SprV_1002885800 [Sparganum proliferum]